MKCEAVMTVNTESRVFWDMMPCSDGRFEGRCYGAVQIQDIRHTLKMVTAGLSGAVVAIC
jgi:spore maturation protein SpmB